MTIEELGARLYDLELRIIGLELWREEKHRKFADFLFEYEGNYQNSCNIDKEDKDGNSYVCRGLPTVDKCDDHLCRDCFLEHVDIDDYVLGKLSYLMSKVR